MTRTRAAAAATTVALLLTGCQGNDPPLTAASEAAVVPSSSESETVRADEQVTLRGEPPEGSLPVEITRQTRFHEITLLPAGVGEEIDVSKPNIGRPPEAREFDVNVEGADGTHEAQAKTGFPLRFPYSDEPFTVTFTPAEGQPDSGTLTVQYEGGEPVGEATDGEHPPEVEDVAVGYEVTLAWEEAEPGYVVVHRGDQADQQGSARSFTQEPEFTLAVHEGELTAVAVYPGFTKPTSQDTADALNEAPPINPSAGVTTIVTPR